MIKLLKNLSVVEILLFYGWGGYLIWIFEKIIHAAPNCDIGWLIYAAKAASNGKSLYKDLFEINPPLIFTLHYLSNFIADVTGSDYLLTFNAFILVLMLLVFALTLKLISPLLKNDAQKIILVSGLFIYTILLPLNRAIFGEREHLFVMFVTPYILSVYLQIKYRRKEKFSWFIYAIAIFGFVLKPFYLIFFLASEAVLFLNKRKILKNRKILYPTFFAAIVLYIAGVYVFTPSYFHEILPMGLKTYYGHRFSDNELISGFLRNILPLPFIILLIGFSDNLLNRDVCKLWLGLLVAAVLLPVIQFKGWGYTYYPLLAFSFLSLVMIISETNFHMELARAFKTTFKKGFEHSLFTLIPPVILLLAAMAILAETLIGIVPASIYLKPFALYFIIFTALVFKKHKAFHFRSSVLIAVFSLIFLSLYFLRQLVFTIGFIEPPLLLVSLLIVLVCGFVFGAKLKFSKLDKAYVMLIPILALFALYAKQVDYSDYLLGRLPADDQVYAELDNVIKAENAKDIFIFNTDLYPAFPLVNYANVNWSSRFHHLWMLPAIYENTSLENKCYVEEKFIAERDFVYQAIYDDLKASPPQLLMFDVSPQVFLWKEMPYFDWHQCIHEANPELDKFINKGYYPLKQVNYCKGDRRSSCAYEIYKQK